LIVTDAVLLRETKAVRLVTLTVNGAGGLAVGVGAGRGVGRGVAFGLTVAFGVAAGFALGTELASDVAIATDVATGAGVRAGRLPCPVRPRAAAGALGTGSLLFPPRQDPIADTTMTRPTMAMTHERRRGPDLGPEGATQPGVGDGGDGAAVCPLEVVEV